MSTEKQGVLVVIGLVVVPVVLFYFSFFGLTYPPCEKYEETIPLPKELSDSIVISQEETYAWPENEVMYHCLESYRSTPQHLYNRGSYNSWRRGASPTDIASVRVIPQGVEFKPIKIVNYYNSSWIGRALAGSRPSTYILLKDEQENRYMFYQSEGAYEDDTYGGSSQNRKVLRFSNAEGTKKFLDGDYLEAYFESLRLVNKCDIIGAQSSVYCANLHKNPY